MSGSIEFGKCDICGKDSPLQRTYFKYDIKCECHSPNHFELICHCNECVPVEPKETTIILKTFDLKFWIGI
jgi:hypothetical protein